MSLFQVSTTSLKDVDGLRPLKGSTRSFDMQEFNGSTSSLDGLELRVCDSALKLGAAMTVMVPTFLSSLAVGEVSAHLMGCSSLH